MSGGKKSHALNNKGPESASVTLAWNTSKCRVRKFHRSYILKWMNATFTFCWSLFALYLFTCQARVTVGDSGLCCFVHVTSFESWLTPFVCWFSLWVSFGILTSLPPLYVSSEWSNIRSKDHASQLLIIRTVSDWMSVSLRTQNVSEPVFVHYIR